MKINSILPDKQTFLQRLVTIDKSPKSLYFIGNIPDKEIKSVAIVGSRKPSSYGKEVTEKLSRELTQAGVVIVSGLALGIDGIAHRSCIENGGVTIAVLGNGLDTIYPSSHRDLAKKILAHEGALISEYPAGIPPLPHHFLERNRIVSGLSDAIIVVEAAEKSGTLSTAAHALNQGKDVFAVPGNITNPLSAGCNALIKQGAIPVTSTQDILDVILPEHTHTQTEFILGDNKEEQIVLDFLKEGIRDGEILQMKSGLTSEVYTQTLSMLEITGKIKSLGANQWTIR